MPIRGWFAGGLGVLPLVLGLACRSEPPARPGADSAAGSGPALRPAAPGSTEVTYDLSLPARWQGHIRLDSLSTAERGRALPGALVFEYLPSDSTIRPQALMVLAVYDSAAWRAVRAEGGPPPGDSVAMHLGRVYVIGLPQSNPFAPGTADATVFQVLQLRPAELAGLIRFR